MIRTTLFLTLAAFALAGCNTVAGMGEDIAAGARTVQNAF